VWVWTLVLLVVLLLLNMVLAIILDVHHSVHSSAATGETLLATVVNFASQVRQLKAWVPNARVTDWMDVLDEDQGTVTEARLKEQFPNIPQSQIEIMMKAARADMNFEAKNLVSLEKSLRIAGSLKLSFDHAAPYLDGLMRSSADPLDLYAAPRLQEAKLKESQDPYAPSNIRASALRGSPRARRAEKVVDMKQTFMDRPANFTSGKQPRMLTPEEFDATAVAWPEGSRPQWLKDVTSMLDGQRKTLRFLSHHVQEMQWHVQHAQMAALAEGPASSGKLQRAVNGAVPPPQLSQRAKSGEESSTQIVW